MQCVSFDVCQMEAGTELAQLNFNLGEVRLHHTKERHPLCTPAENKPECEDKCKILSTSREKKMGAYQRLVRLLKQNSNLSLYRALFEIL